MLNYILKFLKCILSYIELWKYFFMKHWITKFMKDWKLICLKLDMNQDHVIFRKFKSSYHRTINLPVLNFHA
jgi:hypothetical protein